MDVTEVFTVLFYHTTLMHFILPFFDVLKVVNLFFLLGINEFYLPPPTHPHAAPIYSVTVLSVTHTH